MADHAAASHRRALMERALVEIRELRAKVRELERGDHEPIAIVGMSCRFPGAESLDSYWELLRAGKSGIREVPADRWDLEAFYDADPKAPGKIYSRHGGFLDRLDLFDAAFFGITPREAASLDPQQRLLLEVAWEALENAGQAADQLYGTNAGVFVGLSGWDYATLQMVGMDLSRMDPYFGTGSALSVAAGRLSYFFGVKGPSLVIDTACSSSLVAVHLACQSLRARECPLALAAGVSVILRPEVTMNFCQAGMLAPDGRCKTFDAAADGYVRSEGCGVIVLKRLSDALAANDNVLALIRGTAENHDGRSSGLTVPNGLAQQAVIRKALEDGGVDPSEVSYVEAHGTGTSLGDPIEVGALGAVFAPSRDSQSPLKIGSVKTNLGHLEGAAGIAGLIKVVLALEHREIPAHLNFTKPNPHIPWKELPVVVQAAPSPWSEKGRKAGISSFGFSGTNAHVVLEEAPAKAEVQPSPGRPEILVLSARSEEALKQLAGRFLAWMHSNPVFVWSDVCFTAAAGRSHFHHRLALVADTPAEAAEKLQAFLDGRGTEKYAGLEPNSTFAEEPMAFLANPPENRAAFLDRAATFYLSGGRIDWMTLFDGSSRRVPLPTYAFQRQRHWIENHSVPNRNAGPTVHPLLGARLLTAGSDEIRFEAQLSRNSPPFLGDHRFFGNAIVPAAVYLEMALAAGRIVLGGDHFALDDVVIQHPLFLPDGAEKTVQFVLSPAQSGGMTFRIFSLAGRFSWVLHVSGKVSTSPGKSTAGRIDWPALRAGALEEISAQEYYEDGRRRGLGLGPAFHVIDKIWRTPGGVLSEISLPRPLPAGEKTYAFHPVLLDGCLQSLGAAFPESLEDEVFLPIGFKRLTIELRPGHHFLCHAQLAAAEVSSPNSLTATIVLADDLGASVAEFEGVSLQKASHQALRRGLGMEGKPRSGPVLESMPLKDGLRQLRSANGPDKQDRLTNYLRMLVSAVLQLPAGEVGRSQPLAAIGVDSLMAVELRNRLLADLEIDLPLASWMDGSSILDLTGQLALQLNEEPSRAPDRAMHSMELVEGEL